MTIALFGKTLVPENGEYMRQLFKELADHWHHTLEAMAMPLAFMEGAVICCAMDARRSQVYNALFSVEGGVPVRLAPDRAISLENLGEELKKTEKRVIIVGDGAKLCYNTLMSSRGAGSMTNHGGILHA